MVLSKVRKEIGKAKMKAEAAKQERIKFAQQEQQKIASEKLAFAEANYSEWENTFGDIQRNLSNL